MLRTAFVDDVAAAKDFTSGDVVRKTDMRNFFPSPYAGRVVFVDYRNGTVQVQWPWGSEQESPTELIRDLSGDVAPPLALDQTYSSWSQTRFENDVEALKADAKWRKSLTASVAAKYEVSTAPLWRAACKAHHDGLDEIAAFMSLSTALSEKFGDDAVRLTVANLYDAGRTPSPRLALYWKDKGRRYKVTQREKSMGKIRCPRCGADGMRPRTYRANKKVLSCTGCGFSISPKDLIWDEALPEAVVVPTPAEGAEIPAPPSKERARKKAASNLLSIAESLSASSPEASRALVAAVAVSTGYGRLSVINPGVKTWEQHMDEMLYVLKSLDQELGSALSDYEDADEFAKFFEDGISEEEELRKILDRTKALGKVASRVSADEQTSGFKDFFKSMSKKLKKDKKSDDPSALQTSYNIDDNAMDEFVEGTREWTDASHYIEEEFRENRDFFDGAKALLSDMDDVRIEPTRDKIRAIRDRIPALIKRGQEILSGARDHLQTMVKPVDLEDGSEDVLMNEDGSSAEAPSPDTHGKQDPKHFQWTVRHYVDMLRESLDDPDKMKKYLKELYNDVGPQLKAASTDLRATRTAARRIITPVLVRLARTRPSTRAVILPILRAAAGR
jgi:ribosomal protein L37E